MTECDRIMLCGALHCLRCMLFVSSMTFSESASCTCETFRVLRLSLQKQLSECTPLCRVSFHRLNGARFFSAVFVIPLRWVSISVLFAWAYVSLMTVIDIQKKEIGRSNLTSE